MNKNIYQKLAQIEETNWFFQAKRDLIRLIFAKYKLKPQKALDLGAGTGANIKLLEKYSKRVDGIDNSKKAVEIAHKRGIINIYYGDALTFRKSRYDFILCSDIIEHVDEDKFFANLKKIVSPQGKVLITVPAFNFLWGYSDNIAHHKKRYQLYLLKKLIKRNDFQIIFINYWNFLLFFPMIIYLNIIEKGIHKFSKKNPKIHLSAIPKYLNNPLNWLMKIENKLCLNISLPFGVDIVALIRKTDKRIANTTNLNQNYETFINKKWKRLLFEVLVVFWIVFCVYVWWILNGVSGLELLSKVSPKFALIVQDSFYRIWPYVWHQYIFVQ